MLSNRVGVIIFFLRFSTRKLTRSFELCAWQIIRGYGDSMWSVSDVGQFEGGRNVSSDVPYGAKHAYFDAQFGTLVPCIHSVYERGLLTLHVVCRACHIDSKQGKIDCRDFPLQLLPRDLPRKFAETRQMLSAFLSILVSPSLQALWKCSRGLGH